MCKLEVAVSSVRVWAGGCLSVPAADGGDGASVCRAWGGAVSLGFGGGGCVCGVAAGCQRQEGRQGASGDVGDAAHIEPAEAAAGAALRRASAAAEAEDCQVGGQGLLAGGRLVGVPRTVHALIDL